MRAGAGLVVAWALRWTAPDGAIQVFEGNNAAGAPPPVALPAAPGGRLAWVLSVFGPGVASPWTAELRIEQGGRSVLDLPLRLSGRVAAGAVDHVDGQLQW